MARQKDRESHRQIITKYEENCQYPKKQQNNKVV